MAATRRLFCPSCSFVSWDKEAFVAHIETHQPKGTAFKCDRCDYSSKNEILFRYHLSTHIMDYLIYVCDKCGFKTSLQDVFEGHSLWHAREKPFPAKNEGSVGKSHKRKWNEIQGEPQFTCLDCGTAFVKRGNYTRHMLQFHGLLEEDLPEAVLKDKGLGDQEPFENSEGKVFKLLSGDLSECGFVGDSNVSDLEPMSKVTGSHVCEICEKPFFRKSWLKKHMEKKHPFADKVETKVPSENKIFSNIQKASNNRFYTYEPLDDDTEKNTFKILSPGNVSDRRCQKCNMVFLYPSFMRRHKCYPEVSEEPGSGIDEPIISNEENFDGPFKCRICTRIFDNIRALNTHTWRAHKQRKTDQSPFAIENLIDPEPIPKVSKSRESASTENIDLDMSPFVCPTCGTGYHSRAHLRKHISKHNKTLKELIPIPSIDICTPPPLDAFTPIEIFDESNEKEVEIGTNNEKALILEESSESSISEDQPKRKYTCDICPYSTVKESWLARHIEKYH